MDEATVAVIRGDPVGSLADILASGLGDEAVYTITGDANQSVFQAVKDWDRAQKGLAPPQIPELAALLLSTLRTIDQNFQSAEATALRPPASDQTWKLRGKLMGLAARCYLAQRLRSQRSNTGMSLRDVAKRADLAHAYLGQIERCAAGLPSIENAQLLLDLLGMPLWRSEGQGDVAEGAREQDSERDRALRLLRRQTEHLPATAIRVLVDTARSLRELETPQQEPRHDDHFTIEGYNGPQ